MAKIKMCVFFLKDVAKFIIDRKVRIYDENVCICLKISYQPVSGKEAKFVCKKLRGTRLNYRSYERYNKSSSEIVFLFSPLCLFFWFF